MGTGAEHTVPPPLRPGSTIGIVFPAGPVRDRERFEAGARILTQLGFSLRLRPDLPSDGDFLAGDDPSRAEEFQALWCDPQVAAVMAARGGYGCLRLLDRLDYPRLGAHPKWLIGFSDITVLHAALGQRCRLATLHGPVVTSLADGDEAAVRQFHTMLTTAAPEPIAVRNLEVLRPGTARAVLAGGNLTSLCHLLATPFEPDWRGCILFLEEVGEAPYRVDRMLTQLAMAGKFQDLSGVILGGFTDCGPVEPIWQRVLDLTGPVPAWGNFPAGHGRPNLTLPLGRTVTMDGGAATLRFT